MNSLQNFVSSFSSSSNNTKTSSNTNNNNIMKNLEQQSLIGHHNHHQQSSNHRSKTHISLSTNKQLIAIDAVNNYVENKRIRNIFSLNQVEILEKVFEDTHYPDSIIREKLGLSLNLSAIRIQVWFQNRRAKFRKLDLLQRKSLGSPRKANSLNKHKANRKECYQENSVYKFYFKKPSSASSSSSLTSSSSSSIKVCKDIISNLHNNNNIQQCPNVMENNHTNYFNNNGDFSVQGSMSQQIQNFHLQQHQSLNGIGSGNQPGFYIAPSSHGFIEGHQYHYPQAYYEPQQQLSIDKSSFYLYKM